MSATQHFVPPSSLIGTALFPRSGGVVPIDCRSRLPLRGGRPPAACSTFVAAAGQCTRNPAGVTTFQERPGEGVKVRRAAPFMTAGALLWRPPACGLPIDNAGALMVCNPRAGCYLSTPVGYLARCIALRTVYSSYSRGGSAWIAEPPALGGSLRRRIRLRVHPGALPRL